MMPYNNIIVESSIESIEQFPAKLYEQLLPIINNDDSFKEFERKLKIVDSDAQISSTDRPSIKLNIYIERRNYHLDYGKTPNNEGVTFAIHVDTFEDPYDPYPSDYLKFSFHDKFSIYVKDIEGAIKTKKSIPEQYEYFCQQYFNKVNKTLSKAFVVLNDNYTPPIVISTLKQIASKIQEKIPITLEQPNKLQRTNTNFKDFYDAL